MRSDSQAPAGGAPADANQGGAHPHNFDVQKDVHRRIRNDPDYDDWEYGTEPLPHEAWALRRGSGEGPASGTSSSTAAP